jgi:probable HAF family extracellular repeat protein
MDLGNLGGTTHNVAFDVNDRGQVVGLSGLPGNTSWHAYLWQTGVMTDLGTLPGDALSGADSINSKGQVVGASADPSSGNQRAFLWQNGAMADLNTLIPPDSPLYLLEADSINDWGQIAGYAVVISSGEVHAFLATPSKLEAVSDSTAPSESRQHPTVTLPENVRMLLERRARFGGFRGVLVMPQ